ncbi:hypothetical protein Y032_0001g98 [Ancylostoma ceylanicum]|uniref:Uncharacterized protein n=1 Tax=Ancylostoma ceylanicum TaxID=53326 RepID=A0A016W4C9_9BILA|nr:hypothetical protein Y032_0001g98 [Ancylostoma ceylanicum]
MPIFAPFPLNALPHENGLTKENYLPLTRKEIIEAYTTMRTFIVLLALTGLAASWAPCPKMDSITEEDMKKSHFECHLELAYVSTNFTFNKTRGTFHEPPFWFILKVAKMRVDKIVEEEGGNIRRHYITFKTMYYVSTSLIVRLTPVS